MALSSLSPSNMLGELGRLASWFKGDCITSEEIGGVSVTEKVRLTSTTEPVLLKVRLVLIYFGQQFKKLQHKQNGELREHFKLAINSILSV